MVPPVVTQLVPAEALTRRMAKFGLLSTPEMPLRSTTIWLFQPLESVRYVPMTVLTLVLALLVTAADPPEVMFVALYQIVPCVVYCTWRLASASDVAYTSN